MNWTTDDVEAPTAPPDSNGSSTESNSIVLPRWVQRMYGPPPGPPSDSPQPIPAEEWTPGDDVAFSRHDFPRYRSPAAFQRPDIVQINAYTPRFAGRPSQRVPPATSARRVSPPPIGREGHNPAADRQIDIERGDDGAKPYENDKENSSPTKTPLIWKEAGRREYIGSEGFIGVAVNGTPQVSSVGPSRAAALHARRRSQLRTCDKDPYGVPLPNTSRPFSIFASPFAIAEVCTGLGVYLASLQAAIILACLLSICAIYPLVNNMNTQRWADSYQLFIRPPSEGPPTATCQKGWETSSWITQSTIGGHCSGSTYTSTYDCAALCVWDPGKLKSPQCRGVPFPGKIINGTAAAMATGNQALVNSTSGSYASRLTGRCAQHLPCMKARLDPYAPDGPCYCCTMDLDKDTTENNPRVSSGQLWTFFVSQIVFMSWILMLMHTQMKTAMVQGSRVVGPSDFSVWLTKIPRSRAEDGPLAHWCGQFGSIVAAFNVPSVGDALRVGRRVANLTVKKSEAEALEGSTSCNPLQWIYKRFVVGNLTSLEQTLERQNLKLAIYERQESEATGQGLATFEFSESADNCVAEFDTPPFRALLNCFTFGLTNRKPKLHGANIRVIRAPEPSDILWEHTNCTGREAFFRRSWSWTLTALIVLTGAAIQYGLAVFSERSREDRMLAEYAAGTGTAWAIREAAKETRRLRLVVVLSGAVVVTVNLTIMLTMRALSWYERWTTRTSMQRWVMLKLSISQLLNAFAAPVLAAYASRNKTGWYARGGLMEAAFFVQLANALVPPLFHLLGIGDFVKYYILSPFARTQPMLEQLLAPPLFPLAEQHAASVTTLGLAMWYMPVLPISPLIALMGLSVSYCANKYIALRRAAAPPNLSGMVTSSLNWLLRLLPLIQLVLMRELYFSDYPAMIPVFYTGLSFWLLFSLAPIRAFLGAVRRRRKRSAAFGIPYHRLLGGRRLGVGDVYAPLVPKPCSRAFKEHLATTFAQLAPSAFDSIVNGEEVAAMLFGGRKGNALPRDLPGQKPNNSQHPRSSLRASIAAGLHGTIALLWQPLDIDHPEDEFLSLKQQRLLSSSYKPSAPPMNLSNTDAGMEGVVPTAQVGPMPGRPAAVMDGTTPPLRRKYSHEAWVEAQHGTSRDVTPNIATVRHRHAASPAAATPDGAGPMAAARQRYVGNPGMMTILDTNAFRPLGSGVKDMK